MDKINDPAETSDALVLFGATGDLAYKKNFPSALCISETGFPQRSGGRRRVLTVEP